VDQWLKATEEYKKDKAKIVIIICSLCVSPFWQTVEGYKTYKQLARCDVIGLLKLIWELTFNSKTATQYGPMPTLNSIVSLLRTSQGKHEDATTYFQ
jgi:hypothetical protein